MHRAFANVLLRRLHSYLKEGFDVASAYSMACESLVDSICCRSFDGIPYDSLPRRARRLSRRHQRQAVRLCCHATFH